jgi:drug/metabolite transporter (DMT)-like permease
MIARWFLWTLLAVFCWGIWALVARLIGDALTAFHSQALSTIGLVPVIAVLLRSIKAEAKTPARNRGIALGLVAGLLTCIGNIAYYYVLNSGAKAATVVPLTALYPTVTVMLAFIFLHERLNRIQMAGVILSCAAIYFFNVQGEHGFFSPWLVAALIPILFWGVSGLMQKISTNFISAELSALCFLAAFVPVAVLIVIREPLSSSLPLRVWWLAGALGFSFALGNFALLQAFASNGKASIVAPLAGLYPLVSIPVAMVAFKEKISVREGLGITTALAAIIALSIETRAPQPAAVSPAQANVP